MWVEASLKGCHAVARGGSSRISFSPGTGQAPLIASNRHWERFEPLLRDVPACVHNHAIKTLATLNTLGTAQTAVSDERGCAGKECCLSAGCNAADSAGGGGGWAPRFVHATARAAASDYIWPGRGLLYNGLDGEARQWRLHDCTSGRSRVGSTRKSHRASARRACHLFPARGHDLPAALIAGQRHAAVVPVQAAGDGGGQTPCPARGGYRGGSWCVPARGCSDVPSRASRQVLQKVATERRWPGSR